MRVLAIISLCVFTTAPQAAFASPLFGDGVSLSLVL